MSICLSMIVKNEAHVIARCLRSVKPFIDSYSISDTGSTDNTMAIVREELAGIPGVLQSDPWQDFGTNRNLALSRCQGDFVLSIDADDTLEQAGGPLDLSPDYDGFEIRLFGPDIFYWQLKLVRNDKRWIWKGKIHEVLIFDGQPRIARIENVIMRLYGDGHRSLLGDKFERDLKIYESEPPKPRNVFYHAQTLSALGRKEEAIKKYYERTDMGDWEDELYVSLWMAGKLMSELDYSHDKVAGALYRAYRRRPSRYEALLLLCHLLNQRRDFDECYRISSFEPKPMADGLFVDHSATWRLCAEHAYAAYNLGKPVEAQEYLRKASDILDASPKAESWLDLSHAYYSIEDWRKCIDATNKALILKPDFAPANINRCAAYNKLGEFEQAKIAGEEAVRLMPNNQLAINNLEWAIDNLHKNN